MSPQADASSADLRGHPDPASDHPRETPQQLPHRRELWMGSRRRLMLAIAAIAAGTATGMSEAQATQRDTATPALATPGAGTPVASPEAVAIPESPVGAQLAWVLETIDAAAAGILPTEAEIEQHFDETFLAAISAPDAVVVFAQLADILAPVTLTGFAGPMTNTALVALLRANDGTAWQLQIAVDDEEPHLIIGLFAGPTAVEREPLESWDAFDQEFAPLAEKVSFRAVEITPDGPVLIHEMNSSEPLAIGSTFKLFVLGALADRIQAGETDWQEELPIQDEFKSLPSGRLQDEPTGTRFSVREYAELMISISDNTAADHLLHHVGRGTVEAAQEALGHTEPSLNIPFLTTRELFALKLVAGEELVQRYIEANATDRLSLLQDEVAMMMPTLDDVLDWTAPRDIETIEWFASTKDLTTVMERLALLATQPGLEPIIDILALNPGLDFDASVLPYIGYKGGSEPGVLNLTWLLQRADDRVFSVSATLNDRSRALDQAAATTLVGRAVDYLVATA